MDAVAALTSALKAEFASVYLYGLLGARANRDGTKTEIAQIDALYASHRLRRDQLTAFLSTRQVALPAPAVAYTPPIDPTDATSRAACALDIETRSEPVYAQLVAATSGPERAFALTALSAVAIAAAQLGQKPTAFPGLTL